MTIEEKAKAYDEALERARIHYNTTDSVADAEIIEIIFPQFKEPEDEKIKKALIEYFNEQCDMSDWNGVYGYQIVAWLKKQELKSNPYSGVSFSYNDNIWGDVCKR